LLRVAHRRIISRVEPARRSFTIEHCLGRGGFGEVYRAEMMSTTGLSTPVALKILRRDVSPGSQALERLRDEGLLLAQLNHPTILKVHDLVLLEGRVSLVTEFVDGEDLEHCLRGPARLGLRSLVEVVGHVASALDAAYNTPGPQGALRLVHRDIKPTNIRLSRHGEVKLLDFGIARTDELTREARTKTDVMVGSPPYMAPERFLDNEPRSASDVFSLGATLLEGLIGRRVFDQPVTILATMAVSPPRYEEFVASRFSLVPPSSPPDVVALAREMLRRVPEDRPTAGQVAVRCEMLADMLEGPSLSRWCRSRPWPEPQHELGDLDGRVVTEGTLARERPETPGPPRVARTEGTTPLERISTGNISTGHISTGRPAEPERKPEAARRVRTAEVPDRRGPVRSLLFWLGGAGVATGLAMLATGMLVLVLLVLLSPLPQLGDKGAPEVEPAPVLVEAGPVEAGPVEIVPEVPVPEPPTPVASPSQPVGAKRPKPPVPQEVVPQEVEEPEPPPAPPVVVQPDPPRPVPILLSGDAVNATIVTGSGPRRLPASVPPGKYAVHVTFPSGQEFSMELQVAPGRPVDINCSTRLYSCSSK
jgi:serine/threonine protein kinase